MSGISKSRARRRAPPEARTNIDERRSDMRKNTMLKNNTWFLSVPLVLVLAAAPGFAKPHVTDSQVVAEIQDHLYHARIYKQGDVRVSLENGVATLAGTVGNLGAKLDAERAARKAHGVTQVVDQITVRAEDATPRQIAEQARKEIVTYPFYTIFDN